MDPELSQYVMKSELSPIGSKNYTISTSTFSVMKELVFDDDDMRVYILAFVSLIMDIQIFPGDLHRLVTLRRQ